MTHPIQVIPVPSIGEELQKALAPMVEAYQRRQQLDLQQQELKLRQQQLKQQQAERDAQQAQLGATGEMLRSVLIAQDQQQVTMPAIPNIPSPLGLGSAFMGGVMEAGKQVTGYGPVALAVADTLSRVATPQALPQAQAAPTAPVPQAVTPSITPSATAVGTAFPTPSAPAAVAPGSVGAAVRNAPAVAIPQFVQLSQDIRAQLIKQREAREANTAIERAIAARTDPAEQESLRQLVAYKNGGIDLPVDAQRALFPNLFPQGVDPQVATAMLRFGVAGGLTWGQIRSQFGQPAMPGGIPDDFRFPITTGAGAQKQTERQMVAQFHYKAMAFAGPLIDKLVYGYVDDQGNEHAGSGGLSDAAIIKRTFDQATASGNTISQFMGAVGQLVGNRVISDEQRALLDATAKFSNSLRYLMTGAQSNAQEFQIIINSIAEWRSDDAATKAQKAAYRRVMTEAARGLAEGRMTRDEAATQLVTQAKAMGLSPEFQNTMQQWQQEAGGPDSVPLYPRDPQQGMTNEELLDAINRTLEGSSRKNFIMGNP